MNSYKTLNIILGLTLLILVVKIQISLPEKDNMSVENVSEAVLQNIHQRKSVRKYINKPVEKKLLEKILKAGMAAPSAVNKQPWELIVITKRETLNALAEKLPYAKMLKQSTAAIVVGGNLEKALEQAPDYWIQDCSAVTQNILLAVEALKLGAVWTGVFPGKDRINHVKSILNLPKNIVPLNVIAIGYPDGNTPPKDKWNPKAVHWEGWEKQGELVTE